MNDNPLKLGILDCDILHDTLIKEYVSYPHMIQTLFMQVDPSLQFTVYPVMEGEYPAALDECDGYLITGSKSSVYDSDEWIGQLRNYIRTLATHRKKMVGICFGHQLLAHVLGGQTRKSEMGWGVGVMDSEVVTQPDWMRPAQPSYSLLVSHQDQVVQLPPNAQTVATSRFCLNAAFQIEDYGLGFQGHPEFTRGYSRQLMEMRRDRIPQEVVEAGLTSLTTETDHLLVARWIVNFLQ